MQNNKPKHRPYTLHKINSKWNTNLNVKHNTLKLLEDNLGGNAVDFDYDDNFLGIGSKAQSMKSVIDKLDFIHINNYFSEKENVRKMRRQATYWKKILAETHMKNGCNENIQRIL